MFLIERYDGESDADLREGVLSMLDLSYARYQTITPHWLRFEMRESYFYDAREFALFYCIAGSVHANLEITARLGAGFERDIIVVALRASDMTPAATLTHAGSCSDIPHESITPAATKPVEPTGVDGSSSD